MSPFARLGLPADADERAIKRAYAQQLRQTRPEDDPAGFQQLHAAYQAALDWCRQRALSEVAPADTAAAPAAHAAPSVESAAVPLSRSIAADTSDARIGTNTVSAPAATFSMQVFCDEAIALATKGDADHCNAGSAATPRYGRCSSRLRLAGCWCSRSIARSRRCRRRA